MKNLYLTCFLIVSCLAFQNKAAQKNEKKHLGILAQQAKKLAFLNMRFKEKFDMEGAKNTPTIAEQPKVIYPADHSKRSSAVMNVEHLLASQGIDAIDLRQFQDPFENHLFSTGTPSIEIKEHQYISSVPDETKIKNEKRQSTRESMQVPSYNTNFFAGVKKI